MAARPSPGGPSPARAAMARRLAGRRVRARPVDVGEPPVRVARFFETMPAVGDMAWERADTDLLSLATSP